MSQVVNDTRAIPGPDTIHRTVLDNGLVTLVRPNQSAPIVVLQGSLPGGAALEAAEQAGLASFTTSLLSRGSAAYDFAAFNEAVEAVGGNVTFGADTHTIEFGVTCLAEDFPALAAVLADALRRPTFPAEQADACASSGWFRCKNGTRTPPASPTCASTKASLAAPIPTAAPPAATSRRSASLPREQIVDFHARTFTPNGARPSPSPARWRVTPRSISSPGSSATGAGRRCRPRRRSPVCRRPRRRSAPSWRARCRRTSSSARAPCHAHHPDFYALRVANCILGQFGLMGRLGAVVREELGLAYYAYSSLMVDKEDGVWQAAAGVNPEHVDQAIAAMEAEFARLAAEPVDAAELADSQAYLTGVMPLTLETNEGVASALLNMEWFGLGLDYLWRYRDLIDAVTPADVQRVARTYLAPERLVTVVAGP
jgi:zinc protease